MKYLLLFSIIFPYPLSSIAQVIITGIVKNKTGPVEGTSITLFKKGENNIASYSISAASGNYEIISNLIVDSVDINYSCIGYASVKIRLENRSQILNISLESKKIILPEIYVDAKIPLTKRGDTINYNASDFSSKNDRVIEDIIKRLPGIEVEANGLIKYQGKPIINYYIENLDLLGSKYNIANQNIPSDLVDKIQVLENHQPIKAYDSSVISDRAAINIKLKSSAKNRLIGAGKAGIGITPFLWDNELLGLNFRKGFQFISGYKGNNTGKAFSNETADLIYDDKNKNFILERKEDLLELTNPGQPPFKEDKYQFNKTHFFYSNMLFVLSNKAQLRCNLNFSPSSINKEINSFTRIKFINDSVIIIENQNQQLNNHKFSGELVYTINEKKSFLKNTFKIENISGKESNEIIGSQASNQKLSNPMFLITNNCNAIVMGKHNLYEINSNILFKSLNQELLISPGVFKDFFNSSSQYLNLTQNANQKLFAIDNSVTLRKNFLKFNQTIAAGIFYQNTSIASSIYKDTGSKVQLSDSFQNNLHWEELRPYAEVGVTINKFITITAKTTAAFTALNRRDFILNKQYKNDFFFINNMVNINKSLNRFFLISLLLTNETKIGSINQNTIGFILYNYRSISKNSQALAKDKYYSSILQLNYRNPLHILFGYLSIGLSENNRNLYFNYTYYNQLSIQTAVENPNSQYKWFLNCNLSKFFKKSKTGISLNGGYAIMSYLQNVQGTDLKTINKSLTARLNFYNKKVNWVYPEISLSSDVFSNPGNSLNGIDNIRPVLQLNQVIKLSFFPSKYITITPSANSFYSNLGGQQKKQYLFLDLTTGFKKERYDIELVAANITGIKNFTSITSLDNFQVIQSYRLRKFNILLYMRFRI